ncbi:leucine-rich repeat-containing protein, partial [Trifolium pratense]
LASQGTSHICLKIQIKVEGKIKCYAKVVFYEQSKVACETMTQIQENCLSSFSADGQEQLPSVSMVVEWMITCDPVKDKSIRIACFVFLMNQSRLRFFP